MFFSNRFINNLLIKNAATFTPEYNEKYKGLVDDLARMRPQDIHAQLIPSGDHVRLPFDYKPTDENFDPSTISREDKDVYQYLWDHVPKLSTVNYISGNVIQNITKQDGTKIQSKKSIGKVLEEKKAELTKELNAFIEAFRQRWAACYDKINQYLTTNPNKIPSSSQLLNEVKKFNHGLTINSKPSSSYIKEAYKLIEYIINNFAGKNMISSEDSWELLNSSNHAVNYEEHLFDLSKVIKNYTNSPARANIKTSQNLEVLISGNPHDIAQMSTYKPWASCMQLGQGGYHESVYCSIAGGDLVALLVEKGAPQHEEVNPRRNKEVPKPESDPNVPQGWDAVGGDNPEGYEPYKNSKIKARVLIRAFVNQQGKAIFVPEGRVYGELSGGMDQIFLETVRKYITSIQGSIPEVTPETHTMPAAEVNYKKPNTENIEQFYNNMVSEFNKVTNNINQFINNYKQNVGKPQDYTDIKSGLEVILDLLRQTNRDSLGDRSLGEGYGSLVLETSRLIQTLYDPQFQSNPQAKTWREDTAYSHEFHEWLTHFNNIKSFVMNNPLHIDKYKGYSDTFPINNFKSKPEKQDETQ